MEKKCFYGIIVKGDNMQRYFIESSDINNREIIISNSDVHHIKNVMRMKINDEVICVDKDENVYLAKIIEISDNIRLEIVREIENKSELEIKVTVAHGLVRREKTEEVIRRLSELGCYEYIPLMMKRSIVKNIKDRSDRWNKIIKEACEQSQRNRLMNLSDYITMKDLIKQKDQYDLLLFADIDNSKAIKTVLSKFKGKSILVIIGPEGGFDKSEIKLLKDNNFTAISLGTRILRTETAPLYIMSVIGYEVGEGNES